MSDGMTIAEVCDQLASLGRGARSKVTKRSVDSHGDDDVDENQVQCKGPPIISYWIHIIEKGLF